MGRPFIPFPNGARCELIYSSGTEFSENGFYVHKGSPFTLTDLQSVRTIVNSWDAATYSASRAVVSQLRIIRTRALDSLGAPFEEYTLPTPRAGSGGGVALPANVAFCIKFATGLTGRSFRGRWYHGNMTSGMLADTGNVTSGFAADITARLTTLMTNLASGGFTLVVASFRFDKAWRTSAVWTPVSSIVAVDVHLDSMKRRLPGR